MFHENGLCSTLCSTLMFQGGRLCSTGLCSRGVLMFHVNCLCSTDRSGATHQAPPGVAPGGPASENFLVSRATGEISSPLGAPLMYSGWAYVPRKRLMFHLMFQGGAYVPPAYVPGGCLCSTKTAYVPPNDRARRTRPPQVSHQEGRRQHTFTFLARPVKSPALSARP